MTETQKLVAQWQAKQPAFQGQHDTHIGGKATRQTAKAKLVKRAGGK